MELATLDLYIPELCDFQVARPSLGEQEETFLCHGDFTNAIRGLDTG